MFEEEFQKVEDVFGGVGCTAVAGTPATRNVLKHRGLYRFVAGGTRLQEILEKGFMIKDSGVSE